MKKKLKIEQLAVTSFITSVDKEVLLGGAQYTPVTYPLGCGSKGGLCPATLIPCDRPITHELTAL